MCCVLCVMLCYVVCCWFSPPYADPPPLDPSSAGPPRISLFFFTLLLHFRSCSSGCLLVEFWWCLKRRGTQMCTFGLSGCHVKPRRLLGPPGLHRNWFKTLKHQFWSTWPKMVDLAKWSKLGFGQNWPEPNRTPVIHATHRNSNHRSIRHQSNHRSRKCQWY